MIPPIPPEASNLTLKVSRGLFCVQAHRGARSAHASDSRRTAQNFDGLELAMSRESLDGATLIDGVPRIDVMESTESRANR